MTTIEQIKPEAWRDTITEAITAGQRFASGWASNKTWHVLLVDVSSWRILSCDIRDGHVDTIVDLVQSAAWDEREAHDLHGFQFIGHRQMRALAAHPNELDAWTTPVIGDGVHQVPVGPIHAGIIESGHFRFHVIGERILAMDPRLFYKHRGLEHAAEGRQVKDAIAFAQRACAACAVTNTVAYAQAAEMAHGLVPNRELRIARTLVLELERLYNHLNDISAICAGVGFTPGAMTFAALKDRAQHINAHLTGHRFLFNSIGVGHGRFEISAATADAIRQKLRELRVDATAAWRDLEFAVPVQARLGGVGVLGRDNALGLGAVGPAARAAGVRHDLRSNSPDLWYYGFTPTTLSNPTGDVAARLQLRATELENTYDIFEDLLTTPIAAGTTTPSRNPTPIGVGRVESPRGATTCILELNNTTIRRLHLRTGSYANWPALAHATTDNLLPDFPLINKSFELCYACVDR